MLGAAAAAALGAWWWRKNPSACPYGQHWLLDLPRPVITRERLREVLEPQPGERILELGPGSGYYALAVAHWLAPGGELDVLDIQQEMLDLVTRRAADAGIANIAATHGNALELPYADGSFDAAYLVTVLGEIPDQDRALDEIRRVLKPEGRLVVGEMAIDPHFVTLGGLQSRAGAHGLSYAGRVGNALAYFARFAKAA